MEILQEVVNYLLSLGAAIFVPIIIIIAGLIVRMKLKDAISAGITLGVALTSCVVPRVGHEGFSIEDDEMEIGMGIHGETGIRRGKIEPADQITEEMMERILNDLPYSANDEVAVLVNGLGATPLDEQYIVTRKINQILADKGIKVHRYYVGEYATSLEMAGLSISLIKLDDELKEMIDHPANTPFFKQM